ncbi:MAG: hypothetical protein QMD71_01980 [bacterium]|nr:hypothetical protein [bacterium]
MRKEIENTLKQAREDFKSADVFIVESLIKEVREFISKIRGVKIDKGIP